MNSAVGLLLALVALLPTSTVGAATSGIYHPYVNQGETEIEYAVTWRGIGDGALSLQHVSVAHAWTDRLSTELYVVSESAGHSGRRQHAYEFEAIWQLSEPGERWADWGLLFELEDGKDAAQSELSVGVLLEKEVSRRWVAAVNAIVEYEFGGELGADVDTAFRGQLRYLHSPFFEPGIELYLDDEDYAAGPAIYGALRIAAGKQLRWQLGIPFGIGHRTPARSARFQIEYEF